MLNYKENQNNENIVIQEQIKATSETGLDSHTDFFQDYNLIFNHISSQLLTKDFNDIDAVVHVLMDLNDDAFTNQFFYFYDIPKLMMNCFELELPQSLLNSLIDLISQILCNINDVKLFNEFQKYNLIDVFRKHYMNEKDQIIRSLETFSYLSSKYISARNIILKTIDIQFFCAFDDEQISITSYQLILCLCSFALSTEKCDYIMTILQNGFKSNQFYAFDIILQSIYEASFVQAKNWRLILSSKQIDNFLLQYFTEAQLRPRILLILKRMIKLYLIIPEDFLSLIFDFLKGNSFEDENDIFENENESIEIISEIFMTYIKNDEFQILLNYNIFDALILISEKGNFKSKTNSVYCIAKLYHLFIKNEHDGSLNILLINKIVDIFIQFLSLPQQDITLCILISLINIINNSISLNVIDKIFVDQNEFYLQMNLENLLLNDDSLIVEKAQYLNDLIQPIITT